MACGGYRLTVVYRIVKGVTGDHLVFIVGARRSETGGIVVHPGDRATEFKLTADKRYVVEIRHAVVVLVIETADLDAVARLKPVRRTDTGEAIDDGHRPGAVAEMLHGKCF